MTHGDCGFESREHYLQQREIRVSAETGLHRRENTNLRSSDCVIDAECEGW